MGRAVRLSFLGGQVISADTALRSGNFISVDFETAYNRLKNIAGVAIDESDLHYLNELRDIRNRIQHFAIEVEIEQVISFIVKGINFSLSNAIVRRSA